MREPHRPEIFSLTVPSDAAYLATVRLFIASTFRLFGAEEDQIADLKLAVTEASSAILLKEDHPTVTVEITRMATEDLVTVGPLLSGDLSGDELSPADVVLALFPTARLDADASQLVIPVEDSRDE